MSNSPHGEPKFIFLLALLAGFACVVLWSQARAGAVDDPTIATLRMPMQRQAGIQIMPMLRGYSVQARATPQKDAGVLRKATNFLYAPKNSALTGSTEFSGFTVARNERDSAKYAAGEWAPKPAAGSMSNLGSNAAKLIAEKAARQKAWAAPKRTGMPVYQPPKAGAMGSNAAALKAQKAALQSAYKAPSRTGPAWPTAFYTQEFKAPKAGALGQKASAIQSEKSSLQAAWVQPQRTGKTSNPAFSQQYKPKYQPPKAAAMGQNAEKIAADKAARQKGWVQPERKGIVSDFIKKQLR
eukprot:gnl/TRDRNA2_/TRDRNA2_176252_c1_seq1.p1 gnl/TRDRNA2_/TRDRNA2_176252_c1~~gnl/TRDRNA2_/TRDRNA2_176252_c1_seq1.p1  ORF type:complete len:327 (+),score=51.08 gnl/TRDRNA2_/TRDRNA2_176252_c1_seq1:91-981(+)